MGIPNATHQVASNAIAALGSWISLHTSAAGTTGANEASGGDYAREQTTWTPDAVGDNNGSQVNITCAAATYAEGGIFSTSTNAVLSIPSGVGQTGSGSGGTLAAGTYYWTVTAINFSGETTASAEMSATLTGSTSSCALSCSAVDGASGYNWYRGSTSGAENVLVATTTDPSYTDTGDAGTSVTPPDTNTASTFVGSAAFTGGSVTISGTGSSMNVSPTVTC